ncbi:MAG: sulfotransferase [Actinomycetota bacterium]|nr:sulfotransferase [Actinomycetota bacterium]
MFFVVGSARSGTTLLRLMLNAHSEIAVPPESRFIVQLYRPGETSVEELLAKLSEHPRYQAWGLPIEAVRAQIGERTTAPYHELIEATYRAYATMRNKRLWGDKTPRYVLDIGLLAGLFDDALFIHVVRDGRNVALSYADMPFGPKTVARAADRWQSRVRAGREAGRTLPSARYTELFYERLVAEPEQELQRLCSFIGVSYQPEMLDYGTRSRDEVQSRAQRYNPHVTEKPTAGVRSWEQQMPPLQVAVFEAVAGELLEELGYERACPEPGAFARLQARLGRAGVPVNRLKRSAGPG